MDGFTHAIFLLVWLFVCFYQNLRVCVQTLVAEWQSLVMGIPGLFSEPDHLAQLTKNWFR